MRIVTVLAIILLATMAMKLNPPEFSKHKSYERYKQELTAWREITDLSKEKQGIAIALSLPENDNIREKVFDEIDLSDLKKNDGFESLIEFLDKHLGKDDLADSLEKFEDFEDFRREKGQPISDFISLFDQKYHRIEKKDMVLPPAILAFKLLKCSNITKAEKMLVMTGIDYSKPDQMYEQAKKSLKKFKGEEVTCGEHSGIESSGPAIKVEKDNVYVTGNEEVYATRFNTPSRKPYNRGRNFSYSSRGSWRGQNNAASAGSYQNKSGYYGYQVFNQPKQERPINPTGPDGRPITCKSCGSYRHLMAKCPDSWENRGSTGSANIVDSFNENVVLFTGYNKEDVTTLGHDARNCAVLDSACSSTVCGKKWFEGYYDTLSEHEKSKVIQKNGHKVFKFGGGEQLQSLASCEIPAVLAGKSVTIQTDVVDSNIPLLLSIDAMKRAKIKLDLENDTAVILGEKVNLDHTSSGHYCIPIDNSKEISVESVCQVQLQALAEPDQCKMLLKLHRQFAHPPASKLASLLKDAGVWQDKFAKILDGICNDCELCKTYKRTPPRPVVALPMATRFNEKVAMDLKQWNNKWILHMIDMFSRFTVSVFIERKTPSVIVDKVMTHWIGAAFGVMESILTDNGGEFSNEEIREVASILNVQVCTTAAYSPFQNGLCERIHAVTDGMLTKLQDQYPQTSLDILLAWANMARNSLHMYHGYSSYQIVFGKNPNLPNVMTENVPALDGITSSETFAQHLNILHASRKAFIESESDERIRRALRSKIRASQVHFEHGDRVYYKRENHTKWLGPGKVVFQDGKVVFIRHGGVFVRVSPNRIIRANEQFSNNNDKHDERNNETKDNFENKMQSDSIVKPIQEIIPDCTSTGQGDNLNLGNHEEPVHPPEENDIGSNTARQHTPWSLPLNTGDKVKYKSDDNQWHTATIISRAGKSKGPSCRWYNIRDENTNNELSIKLDADSAWYPLDAVEHVNIVVIPKHQQKNEMCHEAKRTELTKLKKFDTYEEVVNNEQNTISTTWVLWKKGEGIRARLVARGFEENAILQKDSPTVGKQTLRVFLAIAASKSWGVKTTDIKSAFLQSKQIDRDVYVTPPKEAGCPDGYIWKLKRCLYGLNDAARQFFDSVTSELKTYGCQQSDLDPALFYIRREGRLVGMLVSHIDDFLHAGEPLFDELVMSKLRARFLVGKYESDHFQYIGFCINARQDGIIVDQKTYLETIDTSDIRVRQNVKQNEPLSEKELTNLRSLTGRLNWIAQGTRPDLVFDMVELSMVFKKGTIGDLVRALKLIRKARNEPSKLCFPALSDPNSWTILVFTDAAHANLCDGVSSMGAQIVFLVDRRGKCCPLEWHGGKIKRVVRSTIAAEALSLLEGLELALYLKSLILTLVNIECNLNIQAFIDNKSVVEAVYSTKQIDDKRLRLDICAVKQYIENGEVASVRWCPGKSQLADSMTKKGASNASLLSILQTGVLSAEHIP